MVPETIKKIFIQQEISISTIQDTKETFILSLLFLPYVATYGKRTTAYKARNFWNQPPKDVKETDDTLFFKTKLKDQFLKMYN